MKVTIDIPDMMLEDIREYLRHEVEENGCSSHPDAPHGFDRNGSHSADKYVCTCEGWQPSLADARDQYFVRCVLDRLSDELRPEPPEDTEQKSA